VAWVGDSAPKRDQRGQPGDAGQGQQSVTTMVGPRIVRLTTPAWLHAYLDGQRRET